MKGWARVKAGGIIENETISSLSIVLRLPGVELPDSLFALDITRKFNAGTQTHRETSKQLQNLKEPLQLMGILAQGKAPHLQEGPETGSG